MHVPRRLLALPALLLLAVSLLPLASIAGAADDDAGDTFDTATAVPPTGRHAGRLDAGDVDYWRFHVESGAPINIEVDAGLRTGSLNGGDTDRRLGIVLMDPLGAVLDSPASNGGDARVTWPAAHVAGEYRLRIDSEFLGTRDYSFCFVDGASCMTSGLRPLDLGTPLTSTHAEVLLIPPTLADPTSGLTPLDYLDATLRGIDQWQDAIDRFVHDYPQFDYMRNLTVHVEVFDGLVPQRAGYDVIIAWAPYTGPHFRGVAITAFGAGPLYNTLCLSRASYPCTQYHAQIEPVVHDSTRLIVMSQFASAPRSGQVLPDFPEVNDVYNVAMHEFAHTWGMGHTTTWTTQHGADLMLSPYTDVFGDGDPTGDGGERTRAYCISTLDLYGLAHLYAWSDNGGTYDIRKVPRQATLPSWMPYAFYC